MEYTDFVKNINGSLYVLIPKKIALKEDISEDDNIRINVNKIRGNKE